MLKKIMLFSILLLAGIICFNGSVYAGITANEKAELSQQQRTINGTIEDALGPLVGASIAVKGTTYGVISDVNGDFSINVSSGQVLVISYLGYTTQEIPITDQAYLQITLQEDERVLGEVVVTALGIAKQDRSIGYATSRVSPIEIERANTINPVNALQGKVAGLNIQVGGASGVTSSSAITIRGAKSIDRNNSPIFVIDGIIIQEDIKGHFDGTDWGSQLKNLNPADYESINVLKGAAATALYGSRGANGAIVIVSKGGKYGKRGLGIEVSQTLEATNVYKNSVELQDVFGMGYAYNGFEGGFAEDGSLMRTTVSWGPRMDGSMHNQSMPSGENTPYSPHPDNWKALYQQGINSTTNFAINGGDEKSSFRISYSYVENEGVFKNNEFNRHNISFKGLTELNHVFSVEMGANYAFSRSQNPASQGMWDWSNNLPMLIGYYVPRNFDMKEFENTYRNPETHAVETNGYWTDVAGYLHRRDMNKNWRWENSLLTNLKLSAKIAPWLTASIQGNYNYYGISTEKREYGQGENYGPSGSGYYERGGNISGSYNFMGMLMSNDNKIKIGDEEILLNAIVAAELYGNTESHSWNKGVKGGLVTPGVFAFSNSKEKIEPTFTYTARNNQTFGLSGILNLSWREQVYLELTARNDWLSSLAYPHYMIDGADNYTVFYPSVNASWVFSDSFDIPDWMTLGRLRASISRVGMGTIPYATSKGFGVFTQEAQYDPERNSVLIANPNLGQSWNNDLKPQVQQSIEIGTDLRFFQERLTLDLAYYKTNTKNHIITLPAVKESGATQQLINAGNIQNQGVEISLEGTPVRTSEMRWSIGANYTLNRGKIIELHENVKEWQLSGQIDGGPEIWAYEGGDFGVYTTPYNSSTGALIYRFINESNKNDSRNGKPVIRYIDEQGSPNSVSRYVYVTNPEKGIADRQILGKVEPDYLLSVNTSFSYKSFDFYAQVDGRVGGTFFSNSYKYLTQRGTLKSSLHGRDKEFGGIARTNYKGETVYDGLMIDAVFDEGSQAPKKGSPGEMVDVGGMLYEDAVNQGLIEPMMATAFYIFNNGWGAPSELAMMDNTWFTLREITLGYRLPENICRKFGANYLRLGVTARNVCYLVNKLKDGMNPESISSNNPLLPMDVGGVPFSRTFGFNLTVRF